MRSLTPEEIEAIRVESVIIIKSFKAQLKSAKTAKMVANRLLIKAVRAGQVIRPNACEQCGKVPRSDAERIEGHHGDYGKPLDVAWLCIQCHRGRHRIERADRAQILADQFPVKPLKPNDILFWEKMRGLDPEGFERHGHGDYYRTRIAATPPENLPVAYRI